MPDWFVNLDIPTVLAAVKANPVVTIAVLTFLYLVRTGKIILPFNVPVLVPADPVHPLKSRLADKAAGRFDELLAAGETDDEAYGFLTSQMRADPPKEKK